MREMMNPAPCVSSCKVIVCSSISIHLNCMSKRLYSIRECKIRSAVLLMSALHVYIPVSLFSCQHKPCYIWHVATETGLHLRTIVASSLKGRTNCAEAFLSISEVSGWHGAQVQQTLKEQGTRTKRKKPLWGNSLFIIKQSCAVITSQFQAQIQLNNVQQAQTHTQLQHKTKWTQK